MMLDSENSVLIIIDIQGRLADVVADSADVFANSRRLAETAKLLEIPVVFSEQIPDKLGTTRDELADLKDDAVTISKSSFGCGGEPSFMAALKQTGKKQVVLCGIEAHICVLQTALQLLDDGFSVFMAADAASSRLPENKQRALERARQHGAEIITTEMALFEWTRDAAHPAFREVRKLLA